MGPPPACRRRVSNRTVLVEVARSGAEEVEEGGEGGGGGGGRKPPSDRREPSSTPTRTLRAHPAPLPVDTPPRAHPRRPTPPRADSGAGSVAAPVHRPRRRAPPCDEPHPRRPRGLARRLRSRSLVAPVLPPPTGPQSCHSSRAEGCLNSEPLPPLLPSHPTRPVDGTRTSVLPQLSFCSFLVQGERHQRPGPWTPPPPPSHPATEGQGVETRPRGERGLCPTRSSDPEKCMRGVARNPSGWIVGEALRTPPAPTTSGVTHPLRLRSPSPRPVPWEVRRRVRGRDSSFHYATVFQRGPQGTRGGSVTPFGRMDLESRQPHRRGKDTRQMYPHLYREFPWTKRLASALRLHTPPPLWTWTRSLDDPFDRTAE